MAIIDRKQVEHVAELARLALDDDEKTLFQSQLGEILEYARALDEVDTEDVDPLVHVRPISNVTRPDRSRESLPKEKVMGNAPHTQDGYFRVPKILEGEE